MYFCAFLSTIHKETTITSVYSMFGYVMVQFQKRVLQIIWSQKYLINCCLFLDAKSSYALVNPPNTAVTWSSSWLGHVRFRPRLITYPSWRKRSYLITSTIRRYNILFFPGAYRFSSMTSRCNILFVTRTYPLSFTTSGYNILFGPRFVTCEWT